MDPMSMLMSGAGNVVDGVIKEYDNVENRKLSRKSLQQQERNSQFQRLLSLIQGAQGMQQGMGNAQRLFSLRQPSPL